MESKEAVADLNEEMYETIKGTLLKQGVLQKIKAELRAAVATAIAGNRPGVPEPMPLYDMFSDEKDSKTRALGTLTLFLVKDALQALNLPFSLSIFIQEAGMDCVTMEREELMEHLGMTMPPQIQAQHNKNGLANIITALLSRQIFEPAFDEQENEQGNDRLAEADGYDDEDIDGEQDAGDAQANGESFDETLALSMAETTSKSLEGFLNHGEIGNDENRSAVRSATDQRLVGRELAKSETGQSGRLAAAEWEEDDEEIEGEGIDEASNHDDEEEDAWAQQQQVQNVDPSPARSSSLFHRNEMPQTTDFTQRLRLSQEDRSMLEEAFNDDAEEDGDDEYTPKARHGAAQRLTVPPFQEAKTTTSLSGKRGFITPAEYKDTLKSQKPTQTFKQQWADEKLDDQASFSDIGDAFEDDSPAAQSHELNDLSSSEHSKHHDERQADSSHHSEELSPPHPRTSTPPTEEDRFGAAGAAELDDADGDAGDDDFQDLESIGHPDEAEEFNEQEQLDASDDFESQHNHKTRQPPQTTQPSGSKQQRSASRESDLLASQSADNYDEDFEVEEDEDEVASALSVDPENIGLSDFSAGGDSEHEDSDF